MSNQNSEPHSFTRFQYSFLIIDLSGFKLSNDSNLFSSVKPLKICVVPYTLFALKAMIECRCYCLFCNKNHFKTKNKNVGQTHFVLLSEGCSQEATFKTLVKHKVGRAQSKYLHWYNPKLFLFIMIQSFTL